jgi:hypothetical protein
MHPFGHPSPRPHRRWRGRLAGIAALALALVVLAACSATGDKAGAAPSSSSTPKYVGRFVLQPTSGPPGTLVRARGEGFPADTDVQVAWQVIHGSWKAKDGSFLGRDYKQTLEPLASASTDGSGSFHATFRVPSGFGFLHDVVVRHGGQSWNQASFGVDTNVSVSPRRGPVGTPITIVARGLGWRPLENSWMLTYDNRFTGWLSAVTTEGTARAVIPATGSPGRHILRILEGSFTFPYLNVQQSPVSYLPVFTIPFTITSGRAVLPEPAGSQGHPPTPAQVPGASGPAAWADPASGPVGTPITFAARKLPPGQPVELRWFTVRGNRVSGQGYEETSRVLAKSSVRSDGTLEVRLQAPLDVAGAHRVEILAGSRRLGATTFTMTPSALPITPRSGPAGTDITLHLAGTGWSETGNIYTIVYDNGYLGYACGFNSGGDITVHLPATGSPGWHFIDLYPAIYKGQDMKMTENFRLPQLTFAADHPAEDFPAFHFAFRVTG